MMPDFDGPMVEVTDCDGDKEVARLVAVFPPYAGQSSESYLLLYPDGQLFQLRPRSIHVLPDPNPHAPFIDETAKRLFMQKIL